MKNSCIIFLLSLIILLTAVGFFGNRTETSTLGSEYLRIHIRADSNEPEAQEVKYQIKDEVVAYLTPLVASYTSKAEALAGIESRLPQLSALASGILAQEGFAYAAKAKLTVESFPTRIYGEYTLPAGEYSALIIELGAAKGDNWWCVVYPPLCFAGENTQIVYKSKIQEIIRKFYQKG